MPDLSHAVKDKKVAAQPIRSLSKNVSVIKLLTCGKVDKRQVCPSRCPVADVDQLTQLKYYLGSVWYEPIIEPLSPSPFVRRY